MKSPLILIGGGVRSGKSAFALERARVLGERRVFVATAPALDAATDHEMRDRIDRHRKERGSSFRTVEVAVELAQTLADLRDAQVVVIDCLTLWLSNLLLASAADDVIFDRIEELIHVINTRAIPTVAVTNEVGMGVVPETPLGRRFRDLCGRAHQRFAAHALEVYMAMMGMMVRLKPSPIEIVPHHHHHKGGSHGQVD